MGGGEGVETYKNNELYIYIKPAYLGVQTYKSYKSYYRQICVTKNLESDYN